MQVQVNMGKVIGLAPAEEIDAMKSVFAQRHRLLVPVPTRRALQGKW
jgi:hypothetical protein